VQARATGGFGYLSIVAVPGEPVAGFAVAAVAQALVEYVLIAGRGVYQFLGRSLEQAAAVIGTPRGILIAALVVLLLVASLSRRHRW
jgi:hypothetical protein